VSSYLAVSPLPSGTSPLLRGEARGGLFSVALSFPSPGLRVTEHPALRSSDFPPAAARTAAGDRPADSNARGDSTPCTPRTQPLPLRLPDMSKAGWQRDGAVRSPASRSTGSCPPLHSKRTTRPAGSNSALRPCGAAPGRPLRFPRASPCVRPSPSRHHPDSLRYGQQRGGWDVTEGRCAEQP